MYKTKIKQLNIAYSKSLKKLNKNFFQDNGIGLTLFIEYLTYLRDCLVINTAKDLNEQSLYKTKIATITTALAEFEAYKVGLEEDRKNFHWNNFWELVKLNMEEWLRPNDSV